MHFALDCLAANSGWLHDRRLQPFTLILWTNLPICRLARRDGDRAGVDSSIRELVSGDLDRITRALETSYQAAGDRAGCLQFFSRDLRVVVSTAGGKPGFSFRAGSGLSFSFTERLHK